MDAIIFGTGNAGLDAYDNFRHKYNIIGFSDNNQKLWGSTLKGLPVFNPLELPKYRPHTMLIVASSYSLEICTQLSEMGINVYQNLLYLDAFYSPLEDIRLDKTIFNQIPDVTSPLESPVQKSVKNVLFINITDFIATRKLAKALQTEGVQCDFAYFNEKYNAMYDSEPSPYRKTIKLESLMQLVALIKDPAYDIIHCFGEQNYVTGLSVSLNRPTVHDATDIESFKKPINLPTLFDEYSALEFSHGNIFVSEGFRKWCIHKYQLNTNKPYTIIQNHPNSHHLNFSPMQKLSQNTNRIHCVYAGGLLSDKFSHRYIEPVFRKIAQQKIHMHFYTLPTSNEDYCKSIEAKSDYLHWEGSLEYHKLLPALTKYDIALLYVNYGVTNVRGFAYASPTKLFDYLAAKLPVAVNNIPVFGKYVEDNGFGSIIDFDKDIYAQFMSLKNICIPENILQSKGFLTENISKQLIRFYENVLSYFYSNS